MAKGKKHENLNFGMNCMIDTSVGVLAWVELETSLTDQNIIGKDFFSSEFLDTWAL